MNTIHILVEYDKYVQINPFTKQSFLFSFGYTKLYIFSITGDLEHELDFGSHAIWKTATSFWYYDPIQNTLASYDLNTATSTMYNIDFKPSSSVIVIILVSGWYISI